jgi:hypothetical protein
MEPQCGTRTTGVAHHPLHFVKIHLYFRAAPKLRRLAWTAARAAHGAPAASDSFSLLPRSGRQYTRQYPTDSIVLASHPPYALLPMCSGIENPRLSQDPGAVWAASDGPLTPHGFQNGLWPLTPTAQSVPTVSQFFCRMTCSSFFGMSGSGQLPGSFHGRPSHGTCKKFSSGGGP